MSGAAGSDGGWRCGVATAKITPAKPLWMGGFAARTKPAEGTLDDLWVKVLALETPEGIGVIVTTDLVGTPKWLYDNLCSRLQARHGLSQSQILIANSHTHSGPVLRDALQDIYPLDDALRALSAEYSSWLEETIVKTVGEALVRRSPVTLWAGEGKTTFAVNRRTNNERELGAMLARGEKPKGPSDFAVPVLAVRAADGRLRAVLFGYAAHTSTLNGYKWSADYAGYARRALEAKHPGAKALFFQGCGSDQSAAPRGTLEQCIGMGENLGAAVEAALEKNMRQLPPRLRTAHEFVPLDFGEQPTKTELEKLATAQNYEGRWARRLLKELEAGRALAKGYPEYPVQVWKLGADQLWITQGGEVCVDYALMHKARHGAGTWVAGYANDVMAYIPSRRLWEEGGYQAGAFAVYGLPAKRWTPEIETLISAAVARLVEKVR
ncbi:MAG: hypothetical protein NTY01_04545 [Verrucomicrobia bacterium]|nr:hypothetical protein [Verrucomicrobiota bacterium]